MLQNLRDYFTGLFFRPDKEFEPAVPVFPEHVEEIYFSSTASPKIHGYLLRSKGQPRGTVVHCHGNAGEVGDHVPLVQFLADAGYNLLAFDYGGYGHSTGQPSPDNIVIDA